MFKFNLPIFTLSLLLILASGPRAFAQTQQEPPEQQPQPAPQEPYQESALRRFEIITLSSLPFTVVHSYLVVRGVKMYRESQFAPELSPQDYRMIGIGAVSLSLFIGGWDWWRTRNVDRAAPRFQEREPPPEEEEQPEEGPGEEQIARLPQLNPPGFIGYPTNTVGAVFNRAQRLNPPGFTGGIGEVPSHNVLNRWANEPAAGIAVPLLLIRF